MKKIEIDFNNRGPEGTVRGSLARAGDVKIGDFVELADSTEGLGFRAVVDDIDRSKGRVFYKPEWAKVQSSWVCEAGTTINGVVDLAAGTPVLSIVAGTGITLGGIAGTIILEATATQTAAISAQPPGPQQYVYDLEVISPAGYITRLVEGRVLVYPEVTR